MQPNAAAGPSRLSGPRGPVKIDSPQVCRVCHRDWPVATFLAHDDKTRDFTQKECLRCKHTDAEEMRWTTLKSDMARRIQRAREREPERQRRARAKMLHASQGYHHQQRDTSIPEEKAARQARLQQQQSDMDDALRRQSHSTHEARRVAIPTLQRTAPVSATPLNPARPGRTATTELAPASLRLVSEPLRSNLWLKIHYTSSNPTDAIPQSSIHSHYYLSIAPSDAIPINLLNIPNPAIPNATFPPPALRGSDLIASVPHVFPSVKLSREGFVCVGLRERTNEEKAAVWKQVQLFMAEKGLGGSAFEPNVSGRLVPGVPFKTHVSSARPAPPSTITRAAKASIGRSPGGDTRIAIPALHPAVPSAGQSSNSLSRFITPAGAIAPPSVSIPTLPKFSTSSTHSQPTASSSQGTSVSGSQGVKRKRLDLTSLAATRPSSQASSVSTVAASHTVNQPQLARPQTPDPAANGTFDPFALKPPGSVER